MELDRETIDDLEADRNLDCLVAEYAMGWTEIERKAFGYWGTPLGATIVQRREYSIPHYSTSLNDAMDVVDKLTDGKEYQRHLFFIGDLHWRYHKNKSETSVAYAAFDWQLIANTQPLYEGRAKSIPHAICLAALKAVVEQKSDSQYEQLAEEAHGVRAEWIEYMFSQGSVNSGRDTFEIPRHVWEGWERQAKTPYIQLTEPDKETDRDIAQRYISIMESWEKA